MPQAGFKEKCHEISSDRKDTGAIVFPWFGISKRWKHSNVGEDAVAKSVTKPLQKIWFP